ncbi:hypothetical protein [uncultured Helicobacter sp.]|uniref:hypothetical protein n=1 Tax=uncultured Helicobacter sp. TaxID=175537 RepID=UPI00261F374A|nr:hypothetical protein [uncultured Helicobacter sp.]
MFKGLLQFFYSKVLIGLNLDHDVCQLHIIRIKNGSIKQNIKTDIKTIDNIFPAEALKLIKFYKKKYPFTYTGVFSKTYNQGAIPTTDSKEFIKYDVNLQGYSAKSFDNTWSAYIKNQDCYAQVSQYKDLGDLDLVFSPFISIYLQSKKEMGKTSLFLLQEKLSVSVVISDGQKVFFGGFFETQNDVMEAGSLETEQSLTTSISNSFEDILSSMSDNIDDLDDLDFDLLDDDESDEYQKQEQNRLEELKDFMRATTTVGILENVISTYYSNPNFESAFIEQIVILDTYGITPDAIRHIKDSLMIETFVRPFSIAESITTLMLEETKRKTL